MVSLGDIILAAQPVGGHLCGSVRATEFDGFAFDSRRLRPGELFLALRTAKADGHDFIKEALQRGANGLICERAPEDEVLEKFGSTCVVVDDARAFLEAWGAYILAKYHPSVVAITGSVGKTTTQNAIRAIFGQGYDENPSIFTNDNYNDLFGLPIALSRLTSTHDRAILELASDSFGEIASLAAMIKPHLGVVTNAAPIHLQHLDNVENLAAEYRQLLAELPRNGYAVLNFDDPLVQAMQHNTEANVVFYSATSAAVDFYAERVTADEHAVHFHLHSPYGTCRITIPLLGRHHVYTGLAATAVGVLSGLGLDECVSALSVTRPLPGRLSVLEGANGVTLLDDSFSASPASVRSALDTLSLFGGRRRFFILGDMHGLGHYETTAHEEVGNEAAAVTDFFITRGDMAALAAKSANLAGLPTDRVYATFSNEDVHTILTRLAEATDVVLVKGSEDARMEQVVEMLLANPEDASASLVRQDAGWKQLVRLHRERPTWLEIDLGAIAHNITRVKEIVGPTVDVLAVLKADAYGHGATRVAQTALLHGASMLGTACLSEALALRERGIVAPILVLGYTPPWQAREMVRADISSAVYSIESVKHLSRAAGLRGDRPARVHVKVDTGMARLGVAPEEAWHLVEQILMLPNVELAGIFTHLASADTRDQSYARQQLSRFDAVLHELADHDVHPRYIHAANSAAMLTIPEARYNLVRLGIALYGLDPSTITRCPDDFRRALAFKTQIAQVKHLPKGSCVSYGCTFHTERASKIAVIPAGYGDGFRRGPHNGGYVLVRGQRANIVGVVCMDMSMIDVTDIVGVRQGDEVVIVGEQFGESITVDQLAANYGTINYEAITQILPRVPREVF